MNPVEVERKVRQLDNDTQAIYEMLAGISATQQRHGNRLDALDAKIDTVDERLTARLDGIDGRLDGMQGSLTEILRRLPAPPA